MKVVIFCGGYGTRLRDYSETIPKPMVPIGYRPILWHIMKYYAHFGHTEFVLCLGWQSQVIRDYFRAQPDYSSVETIHFAPGLTAHRIRSATQNWTITLADTGCEASVGERLRSVQPLLENEPTFFANYSDGLTDLCLPELVNFHVARNSVTTFLSVRPQLSFHTVETSSTGQVKRIRPIRETETWINGGFFVMSHEVFDYLHDGEDLIAEPFERMVHDGRLHSMRHEGFWSCMDTYKEKQAMDEMWAHGITPWQVWNLTPNPPVFSSQLSDAQVAQGKTS